MTLVAVWAVGERIYAAADSRFTAQNGVLTEHGPKILTITVVCSEELEQSVATRVAHGSTIGFAYAGATLPALSTHALANMICSNLLGRTGSPAPGLDEIAMAVADIAAHYMGEVGVLSSYGALFKAVLFGWCMRARKFRAFVFDPDTSVSPINLRVEEKRLELQDLIVIGNEPELLIERVAEMRPNFWPGATKQSHIELREIDLPKRALQAIIDEKVHPNIGGALQFGWGTRFGFSPASVMTFINPPEPSGRNAAMTVIGFDLMRFRQIGQYVCAIAGRI